ncbi:hypothetical protein CR513_28332, partial [Mucuna pruriens]
MTLAEEIGAQVLTTKSDSQLVTGQRPIVNKILGHGEKAGILLQKLHPLACAQSMWIYYPSWLVRKRRDSTGWSSKTQLVDRPLN